MARRAVCPDGVIRAFRFTGEADTFFTRPAAVSVNGRTVSGFVTSNDDPFDRVGLAAMPSTDDAPYQFWPRRDGKNGRLLPAWPPLDLTRERANR